MEKPGFRDPIMRKVYNGNGNKSNWKIPATNNSESGGVSER
jgi:hypothetical protein